MQIDSSSPIPVYFQIEQLIEQLILKQQLATHEVLPSVAVLSRQLKVAPLTVQRAYRRLQERGLIYSITGKGSFVADASSQQFIGILVHNQFMLEASQAPTMALLIQTMSAELRARRLPVRILTDTHPHLPSLATISPDVMSTLEHGRPVAMILMGHYGSQALFDLAKARSIPVIGFHVANPQAGVRVMFDIDQVLRESLAYLRGRKVTQVGVMWLDLDLTPGERHDYTRYLERVITECGMDPDPDWIIGVHQASDWAGYHAFNHLCALPRRPQGLVVLDDVIGRGVHMAVLGRQIRVPEDLAIVVQVNEDSPIVFPRQWRQCGYNLADCGRIAVDVLDKLLNGASVAPEIKLPFKWHADGDSSPWETPNLSVRNGGKPGPMFRSGRQALETV